MDSEALGRVGCEHPEGRTSIAEAARTNGQTVAEVEEWREKLLLKAENVLRRRSKDEETVIGEQLTRCAGARGL